jgi:hypothetical protein
VNPSEQLTLDFEGPFGERMGALRARLAAIDAEALGLTPNQWDRVATLLRAVFAFSRGEWEGYAQVAPERLQESAELSRRQVSEARVAAVRLGLLASERHYPRRGEHRLPDKLWVVRERLEELVADARRVSESGRVSEDGRAVAQALPRPPARTRAQPGATGRNRVPTVSQPGAHKETHNPSISLTHSGRPSTGQILLGDGCDPSAPRPLGGHSLSDQSLSLPASPAQRGASEGAPADATRGGSPLPAPDPAASERFGRSIGKPRSRADEELAWKLTALAGELGEAWLAEIVAAVRTVRPARPWAYAWRVAAEGTRERPGPGEQGLRRLLRCAPPPPPDWPRPADAGLSRRLCVARDE